MNIVLNRDLYIKVVNEVVYILEEYDRLVDVIRDIVGDINITDDKEILAFVRANFPTIIDRLVDEQLFHKEEDNNGFYKIFFNGNEVVMMNNNDINVEYHSLEEVNKEYINLRDFLMKANYVGKYLEPVKDNMARYALIYEYKDFYLLHNLSDGSFTVKGAKSSFLSNYCLGDMIKEEYKLEEVYQAIVNQELKNGRMRN